MTENDEKLSDVEQAFEDNVLSVLESILDGLVSDPDVLEVEYELSDNGSVTVDVTGPREEIGKVLGRHKSLVQAIEAVLYAISRRYGYRISLNVHGEGQAKKMPPRRRRMVSSRAA